MQTLSKALPLASLVPPDTAVASPGTTGHSFRALGRDRTRQSPRPGAGHASEPADLMPAASQPGTVQDLPGAEADALRPARQSPTRRGGPSSLNWLRAGAAVVRYSARFLPAVLRPHAFVAPAVLPVLRMTASLPGRRLTEWRTFFRCPEEMTPAFTYFTNENSRLLFRLLGEFGLNFRHLLLVQHDLVAGSGPGDLIPEAHYTLEVTVEELRVWPRQRVTFACRCVVRRAGHETPVFETSDRFLVKEVPGRDCEALARRGDGPCGAGKEPPAPRLDPTSPSVREQRLRIPENAGIGFGLLSGDLNLVHAHVGLARLFGHRRPFAQGRYTSNRVVAALARLGGRSPSRLSIRFCRPLFLGQDARLRHSEEAFEVLDAHGSLVAAGTYGD